MSSREGNHLDDLLLEWEERRERGESVLPEELCAAVPHLIHELVRRIRLLEAGDRLVQGRVQGIASDGSLELETPTGVAGVAYGEVVHVDVDSTPVLSA